MNSNRDKICIAGLVGMVPISLLLWGYLGIIPIFIFSVALSGRSKKAYLGVSYVMLVLVVFGWLAVAGPAVYKILYSFGVVSFVYYVNNILSE